MKKNYIILSGLFLSFFAASTVLAQDIYMKCITYEDVVLTDNANPQGGQARDNGKTVDLSDYIRLNSMRFGTEQTLSIVSQSSGAGAGKIAFEDLEFTKAVDLSSTKLMQIQASGTAMKTVEVIFVNTGKTSDVRYKIILSLAAVHTFAASSAGGCDGGCPGIAEAFSFSYGSLQIFTYTQKTDGSIAMNPNPFGWDRVKNIAIK